MHSVQIFVRVRRAWEANCFRAHVRQLSQLMPEASKENKGSKEDDAPTEDVREVDDARLHQPS